MATTKINTNQVNFNDGWINTGTFTYASADAPTFTITVASGAASIYNLGDRIKLTQSTGGTKYFIITKIADTVLTVYGGTDYTLNNEAVTAPYYSHSKSPLGFPLDVSKWTVSSNVGSSAVEKASPVSGTYYYSDLGSITLDIPIGIWNVEGVVSIDVRRADGYVDGTVAISTANNSSSDVTMRILVGASGVTNVVQTIKILKNGLSLASKTTYYFVGKTDASSVTDLYFRGDVINTSIKVTCAYL